MTRHGADTPSALKLPGEDGNERYRTRLENQHAAAIARELARLLTVVAPSEDEVPAPETVIARYRREQGALRDVLAAMLIEAGLAGVRMGRRQVEALAARPRRNRGMARRVNRVEVRATDWEMVNQAVLDWVEGRFQGLGTAYADTLTRLLGQTSEAQIRHAIAEWMRTGEPLVALVRALGESVFSPERAKRIAETEVTRAYAEGNMAAWQAAGIIQQRRWETAADERVCPVCGPLQGQERGLNEPFDGGIMNPPAHPRCRCWLVPVAGDVSAAAGAFMPTADEGLVRPDVAAQIGGLTDLRAVLRLGEFGGALRAVIHQQWPDIATDEIILTGERRAHYLARHAEVAAYEHRLPEILAAPDELHRNRSDATMLIVYRNIAEGFYLRIALWLSHESDKQNSIHSVRLARKSEVEAGRQAGRVLWRK